MSAKSKSSTLNSVDNAVAELQSSSLNTKKSLSELWWMFTLRGLFLAIFGVTAMVWPGITLYVFSWLFALYLLVNGALSIVSGIRSIGNHSAWFLRTLLGFLEVGIGVYLFASEVAEQVSLFVIYIGLMFLIQGVVEIVEAFANNKDSGHKVLVFLGGLFAVIAGLILVRYPITAGVTFAWVVGLYAIIAGAMGFVYGLSLRSK